MSDGSSSSRQAYFDALRAALAACYLADPGNPYQQSGRSSGRSSGAARWEETRRPWHGRAFPDKRLPSTSRMRGTGGRGGRMIVCHYRNAHEAAWTDRS